MAINKKAHLRTIIQRCVCCYSIHFYIPVPIINAERVCKFTCKRAEEDCSASVARSATRCVSPASSKVPKHASGSMRPIISTHIAFYDIPVMAPLPQTPCKICLFALLNLQNPFRWTHRFKFCWTHYTAFWCVCEWGFNKFSKLFAIGRFCLLNYTTAVFCALLVSKLTFANIVLIFVKKGSQTAQNTA